MLGLCTFGNVRVTWMTTSRRIRAAVNENNEYLCNMYLLDTEVRHYGLILFFPYLIWFLKHSVRPVLYWTKVSM